MAEPLVNVPTVVSYSSLHQQFAEQNVDIPVPGAHGLLDVGAFKVFPQNRALLLAVFFTVEVFKVSSQDRVQQLLPLCGTVGGSASSACFRRADR